MTAEQTLLHVSEIQKYYPLRRNLRESIRGKKREIVKAVDGVSFSMGRGEILALVGESGSGKTTIGMNVLGLQNLTSGSITLNGFDISDWARGSGRAVETPGGVIAGMTRRERILALRRFAQMIFQDPYESLNPRQKIFDIMVEPLNIHKKSLPKDEKSAIVKEAMEICGLQPAEHFWSRYPSELSGGQRQRIAIASAVILRPGLLVADEPVSMLDVSIRAEILNLLRTLCDEHDISILYITHDLATASYFADRVAVMYLGKIVEIGAADQLFQAPRHPYASALLSVIPVPAIHRKKEKVILTGETPNPVRLPAGCRFHTRCPLVFEKCKLEEPALREIENQHRVACHLVQPSEENNVT
jgi:peptide/nickel transport system ATP-binding protein